MPAEGARGRGQYEIVAAVNSGWRNPGPVARFNLHISLRLDELFHYAAEFGNVNIARITNGHPVSSSNGTLWKGEPAQSFTTRII